MTFIKFTCGSKLGRAANVDEKGLELKIISTNNALQS